MNKVTLLLSLAISTALLSGCGGGSSDSPTPDAGTPDAGAGPTASVPFTCTDTSDTSEYPVGTNIKDERGTDSEIIDRAICWSDTGTLGTYALAEGTPNMNVTSVARSIDVDMTCTDGNAKGTATFDYSAGTVTFSGTYKTDTEVVVTSCTDTYATKPLGDNGTTISTPESITALLYTWGYDNTRPNNQATLGLTTDCPDKIAYSQTIEQGCNGTFIENISITDGTGAVHNISTKLTKTTPQYFSVRKQLIKKTLN